MTIIQGGGGNRNAKNLPVKDGKRGWSNGLFSCGDDVGLCLLAWCLPCLAYGQIRSRYKHLSSHGTPHPTGGDMCSGDCCVHAITAACGIACLLQCQSRGEVRGRYNIEGGGCGDCCTTLCCTPCDLVQESQELELEEKSFGGAVGVKH
ncbi:PLAC8-domain-containing protein [Coprinopsis marcescibilis]|uniref:PLAC8-domain-containing protein n=1 Tax=Coprinopsis marcescibilis TaxID=230819 RepID=A0A5C3KR02_COPMA|nr:PLAC8-domain-containing protein [Coprinopsis marcescibilis]